MGAGNGQPAMPDITCWACPRPVREHTWDDLKACAGTPLDPALLVTNGAEYEPPSMN